MRHIFKSYDLTASQQHDYKIGDVISVTYALALSTSGIVAYYCGCHVTQVCSAVELQKASVDNSNSALVKSTPPLASVAALSVYILTGCRGKMVNF